MSKKHKKFVNKNQYTNQNKKSNLSFLKAIAIEFILLGGTTLISGYFITRDLSNLSEIFQTGIIPGLLITAILTFVMIIPIEKK